MFGGSAGVDDPFTGHTVPSSADTYVWDGREWTHREPAQSPPAREAAAMADDGAGHVVLFGGVYRSYDPVARVFNEVQRLDTWVWDGTTWTEQAATVHPLADGAIATDGRGGALLLGGVSGNETWRWQGGSWHRLFPAHSPPPRVRPGMAADGSGGVLLHGGLSRTTSTSPPAYSDTWRWDGADWTELHPEHAPPVNRYGVDLELGPDGRNVMIGCCAGGWTDMHTWLWNGSDWEGVSLPAMPSFSGGAAMARDSAGRVVVADPVYSSPSEPSYTWVWRPVPAAADMEVGNGTSVMSTVVSTAYPDPLVAVPKDAQGVWLSGVPIRFTLPASGPSALFPDGSTTTTIISDGTGRSTAPSITANAVVGSFTATAAVQGGRRSAIYPLRNTPTPVSVVAVTGTNHVLYVRRSDTNRFLNLGGYLLDPPAVARAPDGTNYYIGVGAHYRLYVRTDRLGWRLLNDQALSCRQPGASASAGRGLHIGCRGLDDRLYVTSVPVSGGELPPLMWTMTKAGGRISSGPAVVASDYDLGTFTVTAPVPDSDGRNVWTWYRSRWYLGSHSCSSQPAATAEGGYYACRGESGTLEWWNSTYGQVIDAGGQIVGTPAVAQHSSGDKVTAYVQGRNGAIYTTTLSYRYAVGSSTPWRLVGGQSLGGVAAAMLVS